VAIHTFVGEAAGDQFGWKSNAVGDLDDDGVLDFVITAPTSDTAGNNTGTIYIYSGATGQELWRATGLAVGGQLGIDAWAAGLINADTTPDVIAGAPQVGTGAAIVFDSTNTLYYDDDTSNTVAAEGYTVIAQVQGDAVLSTDIMVI